MLNLKAKLLLRIGETDTGNDELFASLLHFLLDPLVVILCQLRVVLEGFDVGSLLFGVVLQLEAVSPVALVKV